MASVPLRFIPPDADNLVSLKIWEGIAADGPFNLIETVGVIGSYPDYITEHTTDDAVNATDWFAISWLDSGGFETPLSSAIKGGTTTLVGEVIQRVRERDHTLSIQVAKQEAEGAIEYVFNVDPYTLDMADLPPGRVYRTINGLVYLTMARSYLLASAQTQNVSQATLGLVSFKTASGTQRTVDVQKLLDVANGLLGISTSVVLQLAAIECNQWDNVLEA